MGSSSIERILGCPTLPSAPGIAARVLELTADPGCELDDLAALIRHDQGLAARIVRTVNSSFYGLRERCATVERAVVLLGIGPVRTLAVAFSLVDTLRDGDGFPNARYWRRAMYSAVAAERLAQVAGLKCAPEAFLAGLLQDIGMIAMRHGLGRRYIDLVEAVGDDHRELTRHELDAFETQHADIGGMLAARWRFPEELVLPIKYHDRPTAAPASHAAIVRAVGLGAMCYEAITKADDASLTRVYACASEWLGLDQDATRGVLEGVGEPASEMAAILQLALGEPIDCERVVREAWDRMIARAGEPAATTGAEDIASLMVTTDEQTGAMTRDCFDQAIETIAQHAVETSEPMGLVAVAFEQLDRPSGQHRPLGADTLLRGAAAILRKHFEPQGGVIGRLSGSLLAVGVRGMAEEDLRTAAEGFRAEFELAETHWLDLDEPGASRGASVGVAWAPAAQFGEPTAPSRLLGSAIQSVQAARTLGGNRVVVGSARLVA